MNQKSILSIKDPILSSRTDLDNVNLVGIDTIDTRQWSHRVADHPGSTLQYLATAKTTSPTRIRPGKLFLNAPRVNGHWPYEGGGQWARAERDWGEQERGNSTRKGRDAKESQGAQTTNFSDLEPAVQTGRGSSAVCER